MISCFLFLGCGNLRKCGWQKSCCHDKDKNVAEILIFEYFRLISNLAFPCRFHILYSILQRKELRSELLKRILMTIMLSIANHGHCYNHKLMYLMKLIIQFFHQEDERQRLGKERGGLDKRRQTVECTITITTIIFITIMNRSVVWQTILATIWTCPFHSTVRLVGILYRFSKYSFEKIQKCLWLWCA